MWSNPFTTERAENAEIFLEKTFASHSGESRNPVLPVKIGKMSALRFPPE
jgi:hypothetical protein